MKVTRTVCDVTGKEGGTLPLKIRTIETHHPGGRQAPNDTEHVLELDLSHEGAIELIRAIADGGMICHGGLYLIRGALKRCVKPASQTSPIAGLPIRRGAAF